MTLPLPWTPYSLWLLLQTAIQLSFVVLIMAILLAFLAFIVAEIIREIG